MNSARTSGRAGTGIQVYPTQGPCSDTGHHGALGVWFSSNFTTHPYDMAVGEGVGGGMRRGGAGQGPSKCKCSDSHQEILIQ